MYVKIQLTKLLILFNIILFSLFALTSNAQSNTQSPTNQSTKTVLAIQHWQTQNGIPVYFVQANELPMIDIQTVFDAGSARDGNKFGLAQFTNAMLNQGTTSLTADQIATNFDTVGAIYNNSVNRDMATVGLRSLTASKFFDPAFATYINVLTAPNFPTTSFSQIKNQTLTSIQQDDQQPMVIAQKAFIKALYGNHVYGHPISGTQTTVNAMTIADLQNFYKHYYVTKNALIAIVGDINKTQATTIANTIAEHLLTGNTSDALTLVLPTTQANTNNITFPSQQTTVLLGNVGINPKNPDYFPLMLGNYTLGGGILVSRLFQQVREQNGLVYGIGSVFLPLMANGPFYIGLQTRNGEAQKAIDLTKKILIQFINNGPTDQELLAAKQNIIGGFPLTLASNDAILSQIVNIGFYHLPINYLDTFRDKVQAVSVAQIRTAFQQYIHPDRMIQISVGQMPTPPTNQTHAQKK